MCAKYFTGNININCQKAEISDNSMDELKKLIEERVSNNKTMFSIPMNKVGNLGYIILVKKEGEEYILLDVKNIEHFRTNNIDCLIDAIKHISGIEYHEEIHKSMASKRNKTN